MQNLSHWRHSNARSILEDIRARNYGQYPSSLDDWHEVAKRYGCLIIVMSSSISFAAMRSGNRIYVRSSPFERVISRRIAHEIAEVVALRDGGIPPHHYQSIYNEPHLTARIVEQE